MGHRWPSLELDNLSSMIASKILLFFLWHVFFYFSVLFHELVFVFTFRDTPGVSEETLEEFKTTYR